MTSDEKTQRGERGLTMVELLVCLGVLALALGSILSVFIAGTRFAVRAQRKMDAGRIARVVFETANARTVDATWGRDATGAVVEGPIDSLTPSVSSAFVLRPSDMIRIQTGLVWQSTIAQVAPGTYDFDDFYTVETVVSHDTNDDGAFDVTDKVVGRYYALLADRSP